MRKGIDGYVSRGLTWESYMAVINKRGASKQVFLHPIFVGQSPLYRTRGSCEGFSPAGQPSKKSARLDRSLRIISDSTHTLLNLY